MKGIDATTGPPSEDELASTQLALSFLSAFKERLGADAMNKWFAADALEFPQSLRKYIFEVASELFHYDIPDDKTALWVKFLEELIPFIRDTRSHIATLNYDDLIYDKIVSGIVIAGERITLSSTAGNNHGAPYMRDGFFTRGLFRSETFERDGDCGCYRHLHGSPLFITDDDGDKKIRRSGLSASDNTAKRHIVLANRTDKKSIIRRSEILSDYWDTRLPKCIGDASQIILFGYSGQDDHLNDLIKTACEETPIVVVEWSGTVHQPRGGSDVIEETEPTAQEYWDAIFDREVTLKQLDNILEFTDWAGD